MPSGPGRSDNPFTTPIPATEGVIVVRAAEFASVPDFNNRAARMNLILDQPDTKRLFVNTMPGVLYAVSYDGKSVEYGSATDLLARIRTIEAEIASAAGRPKPRRSFAAFSKG